MTSSATRERSSLFHAINQLQLTFTCSNSTIKTLGKGVKYVQSEQ